MSFLTAFAYEGLVESAELWARLPVGVVLVMIVLLISWCVSTTFEAKTESSLLGGIHVLKDGVVDFTRGLRGKTSEPGSVAEGVGDEDGQGRGVTLSRSETLKGALNRLRRPRRPRFSTSSTLVDWNRSNGRGPPDAATVEMGEIDKKNAPEGVV
jgi:hypothetical protein